MSQMPRSAPLPARDAKGSSDLTPFEAIITGYLAIGSRFKYSWVQVWATPVTGLLVEMPGGKTSVVDSDNFALPAFNLNENGDNGVGIESGGVNIDGAAYPNNFYKQPIRGDDGANAPNPGTTGSWPVEAGPAVIITPRIASDGDSVVYLFERMNQHDGDCDAGAAFSQDMQQHLTSFMRHYPSIVAMINRFHK